MRRRVFPLVLAIGLLGSLVLLRSGDEAEVVPDRPTLVPGTGQVVEGDRGVSISEIPVTLAEPSSETVTVSWETVSMPAEADVGVDFARASGTLELPPGVTAATIPVTVYGDLLVEGGSEHSERASVQLHTPQNATLGEGDAAVGFVEIVDDDRVETTPEFLRLADALVTVDGVAVPLRDSALRYGRGAPKTFDDPQTPGFDGIHSVNRRFLACEDGQWTMSNQRFAADLVELGVDRADPELIEQGVRGLDWGVARRLEPSGVHQLSRDCEGVERVRDLAGTHATTLWLQALGRAVLKLLASDYAGEYHDRIETYITRMEAISTRLVERANWDRWMRRWLVDGDRNIFTHKTYAMAAGLGLTARLTDDEVAAEEWRAAAAEIAQLGMAQQGPRGANPERGGPDIGYHMFGTWLAQVYYSTLSPTDPLRAELEATIDAAVDWAVGRVDPSTGAVDLTGSTRTCVEPGKFYDAADTVRAFVLWGALHEDTRLAELAARVAAFQADHGNSCPA